MTSYVPAKEFEGELWVRAADFQKAISEAEGRSIAKAKQQEPVAYICEFYADPGFPFLSFEPIRSGTNVPLVKQELTKKHRDECFNGHVYPSTQAVVQPQRTREKPWVSLTDEDKQIAFDDTQEGGGFWEFADAIEAKLKEKNT